jgi:hypothetical protein
MSSYIKLINILGFFSIKNEIALQKIYKFFRYMSFDFR